MRRNNPDVIARTTSAGAASARRPVATTVMLFLLWGCVSVSVDPTTSSSRPLSAEEKNQVESLLVRAEKALASDLLDVSKPDSATYLYQRALSLDPNSAEAERGLEQIVERYVALALTAARQGNSDLARDLLTRSRAIDPEHLSVGPTLEFINAIDTSQQESVIIRGLTPSALTDAIDNLVRNAGAGCRYRISAANDGRARELYRMLREGFVRNNINRRPRAATEISTPDRLERICTQ